MGERNKKDYADKIEKNNFNATSEIKPSKNKAGSSVSSMQKSMSPKTKIYTTDLFAPLSFTKKLGAKTILSLDIDIDKIRYIVVKKIGDNIQVKDWGIQTFPAEITQVFRAMQIALESIKSRIFKSGMEVRVTFFSTDLLFKNDVFPFIKNKKELEQAIILRYKEELKHFKENGFYLEYYVVDRFEEQGIKKQRLQIVFSPKETVNRFVYIFSHLKLPVHYLIPRPMSLVLAYNKMVDDPKSDLLINISYDFTQICYLKYGQLIYLRNLGIGSRNLEVTIKQDEPLSINAKEKMDEGKLSEPERGESLLRRRLMEKLKDLKVKQNPVLHTFFAEILRSIAFIQGEDKRNFVERILLTGYGIQKESLIPYLKSRLTMPVFVLFPGFLENAHEDAIKYGEYTAAFGAVLADKNSINLIPKDYEEKLILARINRYVNLFCIVGAVTFGYLTFLQYQAITAKEANLSVLEAQYHELNPYEQAYINLLNLIGDVKKENLELQTKINKDKPPILEMMRLFSNLTPKAIRLTSFVLQPLQTGGKIENENAPKDLPKYAMSITGEIKGDLVTGDVALINFINSLNNLNIFKSINLEQKNKDLQSKKIEFSLTLTF
ncbi:hypothetical protein [Caldithrix abyssi]